MAFNISALSEYVALNSKKISSKAVAGAQTAQLLIANGDVQFGVKGSAAVLKMDNSANFQDGSTCGRTAAGDTVLGEAIIVVAPIKDLQNLCTKTLYNTHYSWALKTGADPEAEGWDAAFADYLMTDKAKVISNAVEKLLWQGDTTISGTSNLKYINGILKQLAGETPITPVGTTVLAKLQSVIAQTPVEITAESDFRLFVGRDTYNQYLMELANANIYKPTDDKILFGTANYIEVVDGLNGTGKVVATRLSNLQLGVDGADDIEKAALRYSIETENWYLDFHFSVGIVVVYPDQAKVATITATT